MSKYGKIPNKVADKIPWNKFSVELVDHIDL